MNVFQCIDFPGLLLLHGSKEAKMPSFVTIAICGGYIHKMTGLIMGITIPLMTSIV